MIDSAWARTLCLVLALASSIVSESRALAQDIWWF
jgi:hypothetical protein